MFCKYCVGSPKKSTFIENTQSINFNTYKDKKKQIYTDSNLRYPEGF